MARLSMIWFTIVALNHLVPSLPLARAFHIGSNHILSRRAGIHAQPLRKPNLKTALCQSAQDGFESESSNFDWSNLDGVYLITCPNADPGSSRLNNAKKLLAGISLLDRVQVKEFDTDDEDRIRGCYTSHISVLKDALKDISKTSPSGTFDGNPPDQILNFFSPSDAPNETKVDKLAGGRNILVMEDNLALSGSLQQPVIDSVFEYAGKNAWDMIHLSYIPYVPNLVVTKTDNDQIVKLSCGIGSALGTTAYIINEDGIKAVIKEHEEQGYYAPIPDVMAKIFPESRFAAFPTPFVRAPTTASLVNPQLDDLRQLLFQPAVAARVQAILAFSGLSTNALLPITIAILLIGTALSARTSLGAISCLLTTGAYDGPIILPALSTAFTLASLAIIAQGVMLAPKPPPEPAAVVELE